MKNNQWNYRSKVPASFSEIQNQVLIGSLLGDGHLYKYKNQIHAGLSIGRALKDLKYLSYQYKIFKDFCSMGVKKYNHLDKRTGKIYSKVWFRTKTCELFSSYLDKWYIQNKKIVPSDIELTPLICAIWFCDDGSIIKYGKNKDRLKLSIATDGFSKKEVLILAEKLSAKIDGNILYYKKYPDKEQYVIYCSHESTIKFISYIQSEMPSSMKRKSNKWKGLV